MAATAIEWTDAVWNPTRGCSRVSPGCGGAKGEGGCYAERQAARFCGPGQPYEGLVRIGKQGPRWTGKMFLATNKLAEPLRWRKPRRIFVNSMSDLFHEGLSNQEIAAVFGAMVAARHHTFQVLTKRATRMREWFDWATASAIENAGGTNYHPNFGRFEAALVAHAFDDACGNFSRPGPVSANPRGWEWPLPNVHLGVSTENQECADERISELLRTPAAVRFISYEPALGPIDIRPYLLGDQKLDWVIVGSESGPGARPMDIAWACSVVEQCVETAVPVFVKQIANADDKKGGDPRFWPVGWWPREFPKTTARCPNG